MSKYRTDEGGILDTEKATRTWEEAKDWNGSNHISRPTGSQWEHETLHKSAKGRYWLEWQSQRQGTPASARVIEAKEAAAWLIHNDHELPDDLKDQEGQVAE